MTGLAMTVGESVARPAAVIATVLLAPLEASSRSLVVMRKLMGLPALFSVASLRQELC